MYNDDTARGPPTSSLEPLPSQQSSLHPVNVLIMNLPFRARWQDLKDLCRQACPIERADVALEIDGRSRGFGEVTCSSRADAERLYAMFNGYEWQNRRLNVIVMEGQSQSDNSRVQSAGSGGSALGATNEFRPTAALLQPQMPTDDKLLFIGNLPFSMQWQDLKDLLRPAGRVQRTDISMAADGRSRGWGTALFYTAEEAQNAVDMFNETEVEGRRMKVRLDRLGGRGVPANRTTAGIRGGRAHSPSTTMQQQHPGSYPLQQNYSASRGLDMGSRHHHHGESEYGTYQHRGHVPNRPLSTFGPGVFDTSEPRPGQAQYYSGSYQSQVPSQYPQQSQRSLQQSPDQQRQQSGSQLPNNNNGDYYW